LYYAILVTHLNHSFTMKSAFVLSVLCGIAVAQSELDFAIGSYQDVPVLPDVAAPAGDAAPQMTNFNITSVASDVVEAVNTNNTVVTATNVVEDSVVVGKRQVTCTTRSFNAPQVTVPTDSPAAFQSYAPFAAAASAAAQPAAIPSGYALVPEFVNLLAAVKTSQYLTYTTQGLAAGYNPQVCAAKCNSLAGCVAFNICKVSLVCLGVC
jgi:hypothetical protein